MDLMFGRPYRPDFDLNLAHDMTGLLTLNNYLFAALNCDSISRYDSSDNPPEEKVKTNVQDRKEPD